MSASATSPSENGTIPPNRVLSWLDSAARVTSLCAFAALMCSILYDWGFYRALDISLAEIPTSISDHIRSGLVWIPGALFGLGLAALVELFTRRIEGGMTEEEIAQSSPHPERTRRMRNRPMTALKIFAWIALILYIAFGEAFREGLWITWLVLWPALGFWLSDHPRIVQRRSPMLVLAVVLVPLVSLPIWEFGHQSGKHKLGLREPTHVLLLDQPATSHDSVVVHRFLAGGILVGELGTPGTRFVRWEAVSEVKKIGSGESFRGFLCSWVGLCPQGPRQSRLRNQSREPDN